MSRTKKYEPKDTHGGADQTLGLVGVLIDNRKEAEDDLNVGSKTVGCNFMSAEFRISQIDGTYSFRWCAWQ